VFLEAAQQAGQSVPTADGDDARAARPAVVIGQLVHHVPAGSHERAQEGAVQSPNPIEEDAYPDPAEDDHAQDARQKSQGGVGENGEEGLVGIFGAIKIQEQDGEANGHQRDARQHHQHPAFDSQPGPQPVTQGLPAAFGNFSFVHGEEYILQTAKNWISGKAQTTLVGRNYEQKS